MSNLVYDGVSVNRPKAPGELSFAQRLWLAQTNYGLYMANWPSRYDALGKKSHEQIQLELTDLQCALDNLRVPYLEAGLSDADRATLASEQLTRQKHVTVLPATVYQSPVSER